MNRILVVSPHPDDESIGCGGTLRQHADNGDKVQVVFLTSGERGGHGTAPERTARIREREAAAASEILGVHEIDFWRQPDGKLQAQAIAGRIAELIRKMRPARVFVPHPGEAHPDHLAAFRATRRAVSSLTRARPLILTYEVWTPLQSFQHIVDITPQIPAKLRAIRAHRSQCRVLDFAAAMRGLARYRGEMHSWPGGDYAEVFGELRI